MDEQCDENPGFMRSTCPRSCSLCSDQQAAYKISPYLPVSPHISLYLPASPRDGGRRGHVLDHISLYLPTSPCISLYLPGMADGEATCSTIFEMQMGMVDRGAQP